MIGDLYCNHCLPPWEMPDVRLDQPPWSSVTLGKGQSFACPGCRRPAGRGTPRWRPVSVRVVWLTATNQVDQFYVWEVVAHGCKNLPEVQLPHNINLTFKSPCNDRRQVVVSLLEGLRAALLDPRASTLGLNRALLSRVSKSPFGAATLHLTDLDTSSSLASKFRSLGADADDLDTVLRAVKHRVRVTAGADVVRAGEPVGHSTVLLAGMTCSYKRNEDGDRSIHVFHHAGDFCDLYRYILPERDSSIGVQALTDAAVAVIDYRDLDRLLARPKLALAFWRATMLEAAIYRERLTIASGGSALERVAHLLCEQLARREAVGIGGTRLPISQIDVADAAGLSIVHVNRTIQSLRSRNILSKASSIEVIDRKQLAQVAKFDGRYLDMPRLLSRWALFTNRACSLSGVPFPTKRRLLLQSLRLRPHIHGQEPKWPLGSCSLRVSCARSTSYALSQLPPSLSTF